MELQKNHLLSEINPCRQFHASADMPPTVIFRYKDSIAFIGIDNSASTLKKKIREKSLIGEFISAEVDKEISESYRLKYCSRTCFLISPEGHILDKFEISDWKVNLENIFKK